MWGNKNKAAEEEKYAPEMYTEEEMEAVEAHIEAHFGAYPNVFHEIVSPDIHVDICVIPPSEERNHYTLVTLGMGAHRMNVPEELRENKLDRAELVITLPPDWELQNTSEQRWFWPLQWLKILARLPGEHDTWLGWGHTIPAGEPFDEHTALSGMMLTMPYFFGQESAACVLPDESEVNFYQLLPLYEDEMEYKLAHGAEALENLFPEDFDMVLDLKRPSVAPAE